MSATSIASPPITRITRAALLGLPGLWDITIKAGTVVGIDPTQLPTLIRATRPFRPENSVENAKLCGPGDGVVSVDAEGCVVLPGLHDHHIHLFALAAAQQSIDCSPAATPDAASLANALHNAGVRADGTVRGFGYFQSTAGELTRDILDAFRSDVPIRIQHRSGVAWFYNSAALQRVGMADHVDGRLFRADVELAMRLETKDPHADPATMDLGPTSAMLAAYGVTHLTDATPFDSDAGLASLVSQHNSGQVVQHLGVMGSPAANLATNLATATRSTLRPAAKIMLDENRSPSFDSLCAQIILARSKSLAVAIHLTDRSTTWLALAALAELGSVAGDRVEHGSVLDTHAISQCAALGLTVVTNPSLASERAVDHAANTEPDDREHLWRCGSLIDAGVAVFGGTDAPYGSANPWASIRAAVDRTISTHINTSAANGSAALRIGSDRDLTPTEAIGLFTHTTDVRLAMRADLAITSTTEAELFRTLSPEVRMTLVGGRMVTP